MKYRIHTTQLIVAWMALFLCVVVSTGRAQCDPVPIQEYQGQSTAEYFGASVALSDEFAVIGRPNKAGLLAGSGAVDVYRWVDGQLDFLQTLTVPFGAEVASAAFGASVAISGNVLVVGTDLDINPDLPDDPRTGAAYIFRFDGIDSWDYEATVRPDFGTEFQRFGFSVDVSGDVVVVGSPNASAKDGSVYVYRFGAEWVLEQVLAGADAGQFSNFGHSVAISNNTIVVSAPMASAPGVSGMVYAFEYSGLWDAGTKLAYPVSSPELFGTSVDIDNDIIVVGSSYFDMPAVDDQGAAHVYRRTKLAGWEDPAQPEAELSLLVLPGAFDYFGASVSVSGGVVVVGAPGANGSAGSVSSFHHDGVGWNSYPDLSQVGGMPNDFFGSAVAIHGGTAVFGAWGDDGGSFDAGGVSFYQFDGRWNDYSHQVPLNLLANDNFGAAVAVSGNHAVVGSQGEDTIGGTDSGAAYFYVNDGSVWVENQIVNLSESAAFDFFGNAVSISGNTAVVAAFNDRNALDVRVGSVYIYNYIGNQWVQGPHIYASDGHLNQEFGVSVAIEGTTLVVGARHDSIGSQTNEGAAYVFIFNGTIWVQTQRLEAPTRVPGALFGISVGISGNTIVVGSWGENKAYVFERGSEQLPFGPIATLALPVPPDPLVDAINGPRFGWSVAISNDVIGVGAPASASPDPLYNKGAAYLFRKNGAAWGLIPEEMREGKAALDEFGHSVALSTALPNNDQRFVVGSGRDDAGSATAYRYDGQSWVSERTFYPSVSGYDAWFGETVAISGDSILVGAYSHDTGPTANTGAAFFYQYSDCMSGQLTPEGQCVADLNGDGTLDFFDVSEFLLMYGNGDAAVDIDGNGVLDFFDVSEFLLLYSLGCP